MLEVPNELRPYLEHDGPPIPLVDYEEAKCYMLMPVNFSPGKPERVLARVPGVPAVGEANQPTEALATLAVVIQRNLNRL